MVNAASWGPQLFPSVCGKPNFSDIIFCSILEPDGSATLLCPGSQVPNYAIDSLKKLTKYPSFSVDFN